MTHRLILFRCWFLKAAVNAIVARCESTNPTALIEIVYRGGPTSGPYASLLLL